MHCQTPPRCATLLLPPRSGLTSKLGPHRRPLRKFAVFSRAATSDSYRARQKPNASRQAEQLSQLAKEVFEMALQSGPRGFTRSMQAANAFASVGRYMMLHRSLASGATSSWPQLLIFSSTDQTAFAKILKVFVAGAASMPAACGRADPFLLKLFSGGCLRNLVQRT